MVAGHRISLASDDVHAIVRAGEDGVAGDGFSPRTAQVESITIASTYVASYCVVIACTVIHAVAV